MLAYTIAMFPVYFGHGQQSFVGHRVRELCPDRRRVRSRMGASVGAASGVDSEAASGRPGVVSPKKNSYTQAGLFTFTLREWQIGASLLTGTSPTTERIAPLNPEINPKKYKHPY